jgi:hypothetical protein
LLILKQFLLNLKHCSVGNAFPTEQMRMCRIAGHDVPLLLFHFRHEAGYETIGDGGPYPYLGEQGVGVFIGHFKERDVDVVKRGYEGIDGEDDPQVALGVALAVEKENEGTSVPFFRTRVPTQSSYPRFLYCFTC